MKTLSESELKDILYGAAILGTGGGGDLSIGFDMINDALEKGKEFKLADISELPDAAMTSLPCYVGAVSELPESEELKYDLLPQLGYEAILLAYECLQKEIGQTFDAVIPVEMGGANTAVAFYTAAMNDHVILDADLCGRAVPEVTHSTYHFHDIPISPIMTSNEFGETFLCRDVSNSMRAETVLRALAQVSRNDLATVSSALPLGDVKNAVIPGTVSGALELGSQWRKTRDEGGDVAQAVADSGQGFVAFRGTVTATDWQTVDGFTKGEFSLAGTGHFECSTYRVLIKNENMAAWLNDEVDATIPDLICVLDTETGEPVTNPHTKVGQQLAIVVLPAHEAFRSETALSVFGPRFIGLDQDYAPAQRGDR